jgi:hypothetical protein
MVAAQILFLQPFCLPQNAFFWHCCATLQLRNRPFPESRQKQARTEKLACHY